MPKKEKTVMILIVAVTVILIIFIFFKLFNFEGNREKKENISESEVNNIYQNLYVNKYAEKYGFYNGYFTKYNNLSYEHILITAYNYLKDNNKIVINNDHLEEEVAQIPINDFNDAIHTIFGNNVNIYYLDFRIDNKLKAIYNEDTEIISIYNDNIEKEEYYVYHSLDGFEINSNKELVIYDYFGKCNKETQECFNDERMTMKNNNVKYENEKITKPDKLVKYKHTFKMENGKYYWYSSDLIEK